MQVFGFGQVRVADVEQLHHLAFGDDVGRFGHDFQHAQAVGVHHHLEGTGIEEVSHQHAGRVAEHGIGRIAATAFVRLVHHVVMQQRGRVDAFDHGRLFVHGRPLAAQRTGRQDQQGRTQALAARTNDVLGHLADQHDIGMKRTANDLIDSKHVVSDQLAEQRDSHGGLGEGGRAETGGLYRIKP